jgi:F-type H+-transporting ATPase subunit b
MSEAFSALGINTGLLLANVINLVLMILVLGAAAYKPIVTMMTERRERIAEGVNNARRAEEALASAEADKQAILDEARSEAQRLTAEARQRAEEAADKVKSEARDEAAKIREEAQAEAAAERDAALADMRDQIVQISMAAAGQIIQSGLDEGKQKQVVNDFFSSVPPEAKALPGPLTVVTAVPLTDAEQKKFAGALDADEMSFAVDPSILGGVIVRGPGQQVDASYQAQVRALRESLA